MSYYDPGRSSRLSHTGGGSHRDPITDNCSCVWCSEARRTQATPPNWYPVEQQDPRRFGSASVHYPDQGQDVSNHAETAVVVPDRAAQFPRQTVRIQDNFGFAPAQERAGPPNTVFTWAQTPDVSIAESLRRLADRYLNNPNAYVATIHLEPGPSGRFRVIITLEMTDIV